jgi:hypothetical protein
MAASKSEIMAAKWRLAKSASAKIMKKERKSSIESNAKNNENNGIEMAGENIIFNGISLIMKCENERKAKMKYSSRTNES